MSTKENAKWKLSSTVYLWPSSVYSALFVLVTQTLISMESIDEKRNVKTILSTGTLVHKRYDSYSYSNQWKVNVCQQNWRWHKCILQLQMVLNMPVICVVKPCGLVEVYRYFRSASIIRSIIATSEFHITKLLWFYYTCSLEVEQSQSIYKCGDIFYKVLNDIKKFLINFSSKIINNITGYKPWFSVGQ